MRLLLVISCLLSAKSAFSFDIFDYQGASAKVYGGAGITESRGGDAILYNPANLVIGKGINYNLDISPSSLKYKFTPAVGGYGTGNINVPLAPFVSYGLSLNEEKSKFAFGFLFIPTGVGTTTKVSNFPISLAGELQVADLENTRTAYKLGLGMAYKFNNSYRFGISFIYDYFKSTSKVILAGEEFLSVNNANRFVIPRLGFTYKRPKAFTIGVELQPQVTSWYSLDADVTGANPINTFRESYKPTVYGIGIKSDFNGPHQVFGQYRYENWVDGTFTQQDPTQALQGDAPVELLNAHSYILGVTQYFKGLGTGIASFSFFGPNKGQGVYDEEGEVAFYGRSAQDFESLKRYHITAGLNRNFKTSRNRYYVSYIRATGLSEETSPSAGFYELTVYMLGFGWQTK